MDVDVDDSGLTSLEDQPADALMLTWAEHLGAPAVAALYIKYKNE